MWERKDSQEVGSEAATLERVRNSSLVEWSCADNVTGLKPRAEAADFRFRLQPYLRVAAGGNTDGSGRGASSSAVKQRCEPLWSVLECESWYE
jgi:hypothetical protein